MIKLQKNVEAYIKSGDFYLGLKVIKHKLYGDFQLLPMPKHKWKDFLVNFVIGLPILTNWKDETYDLIVVIID